MSARSQYAHSSTTEASGLLLTLRHIGRNIIGRESSGNLQQELALPLPLLLQALGRNLDTLAGEVIQHHDVGPSSNRLIRLLLTLHLDLDLQGKPCDRLGRNDSLSDTAAAPDVVILEHNHRAQVHPVSVCPARQHAVLLYQPEARGCLPRTGQYALVSGIAQLGHQQLTPTRHTRAPRQRIQRDALAQQDAPHRTPHSRDLLLAVRDIDVGALLGVPFHRAAGLREDLVEEGTAGDDTGGFAPESGDAGRFADNEAGVVEGGGVFGEPGGDGSFPAGREEVGEVALGDGSGCRHDWSYSVYTGRVRGDRKFRIDSELGLRDGVHCR